MNALNWFEIPVADMKRAVAFYEAMLGEKLRQEVFGGIPTAVFPHEPKSGAGGALVHDERQLPSATGTRVYLRASDGVEACAARAKKAGGTVIAPKIDIGEPGFIAIVKDTEGNTIGLHAPRV